VSTFTSEQVQNIRQGLHPDCCAGEPCPACGASEAPGGGGCPGKTSELTNKLWLAAYRHDHNNDPSRVLHTSGFSDAALLDEAARLINGAAAHALVARIEQLSEALSIILPMAKGYAHAHPVGSNAEKVAQAEALITCSACDGQTIQTGPSGLTDCIRCNPPMGAD